MNSDARTVLELLIRQSTWTVPEWCARFNEVARLSDESATLSARQLRRWMSGEAEARPASRRVARLVWKLSFEALTAPPEAEHPPEPALSTLEMMTQEIAMSTDDSARWIKRGAGGVDENVLEQLHADVRALAADYLVKAPYELVPRLNGLRREVFDLLDIRQRPRFIPDLYLVAGQVCALMAHACADLGRSYDADTHARTAWLAADYAEDQHLRAYIRWVQANVAYWAGEYKQAARYAENGLTDMTDPSTRLRLASQLARAQAARRDERAALAALDIALDALGRVSPQAAEPGVMYFDPGKARYYAAEVHLSLSGREHFETALEHSEAALDVFTDSSPPEFIAAAELDSARAHLGLGDVEAAGAHMDRVLALPVERRTTPIVERVVKTADELAAITGPRARATLELTDRINLFTTYTAQKE
ncbi:tetratricopeptide (TPR) repeat protein [Nocardia sp. GAS34]|uniref:hypothetical protein n=1 Tax=unclassified Nocardia TaxID=2637762 RepID=UPI003D22F3FA